MAKKTYEDFRHELASSYLRDATDEDKKLLMKHYGKGFKTFDDMRNHALSKKASEDTQMNKKANDVAAILSIIGKQMAARTLLGGVAGAGAGAIYGGVSDDSTVGRGALRGALIGGGAGLASTMGEIPGMAIGSAASGGRGMGGPLAGALAGDVAAGTLGGMGGSALADKMMSEKQSSMHKLAYETGVKEALVALGFAKDSLEKVAVGVGSLVTPKSRNYLSSQLVRGLRNPAETIESGIRGLPKANGGARDMLDPAVLEAASKGFSPPNPAELQAAAARLINKGAPGFDMSRGAYRTTGMGQNAHQLMQARLRAMLEQGM